MAKITLIIAILSAATLTACAGEQGESTEGLLLQNTGRVGRGGQEADTCAYWRNIRESEVQSDTAMGPLPGLEGGARSRILRQRALRDCPEGAESPAATEDKQEEKPAEPPPA